MSRVAHETQLSYLIDTFGLTHTGEWPIALSTFSAPAEARIHGVHVHVGMHVLSAEPQRAEPQPRSPSAGEPLCSRAAQAQRMPLRWMRAEPCSSYSARDIHSSCCARMLPRMEPPSHAPCLRSLGVLPLRS